MQQIIDFIRELDKLKGITRKNRPLGMDRFENAAEHSWQVAVLALSLAEFADPGVDINRVVRMLLIHDVGEIDTGDRIVYAEGGWEEHKEAEMVAARRIFRFLPEPKRSEMMELWEEFEAGETPEARFAHAADRAIPAILNLAFNGQSWVENGITFERVVARIGAPIKAGCPVLWSYLEVRLEGEGAFLP
ncbi:5'-deoxynucleotidase YfbR [Desulfuromonas soudanensis]|uniref:5'-deoxynucleotidase n=1 Tax=Desulfuromonas soudanensis TaxID=1603606 RepID=A0A0M5IZJ1_9BACT|nr:HD domain-containing protein [Desulfuromonas soudanensis]ALC17494.1 5'-deoxynucleotidase YfbR [Desulfuromonas soudanensis]